MWAAIDQAELTVKVCCPRLDHLAASARLHAGAHPETTLALRADTLFIDGEAERCTVTWRGSFPVPSVPALGEEGTVVLLDIGRRSTEILVVANGEPVFARAVSWGME